MRVVLSRDIQDVGRAGDIIDVGDAYARNYVLAKGYGVPASATVVHRYAAAKARQVADRQRQEQALLAVVDRVNHTTLRLVGKANPQGKLFASLKSIDVRHELERQCNLTLPDFRCQPDHFKTLGSHPAVVWLDAHHQVQLTVYIDYAK